jgi:hypothetical protein
MKLQSFLACDQMRQVSAADRTRRCGSKRRLHDYRSRQIDTLFGRVILRQPRWRLWVTLPFGGVCPIQASARHRLSSPSEP